MTLEALNGMDVGEFTSALGWVFEHSPWVAERAWARRPFATVAELRGAMAGEVAAAGHADQIALIRAHPDLGARVRMSEASVGEQAGVGLDCLTPEEFDSLWRLNTAYREKFGFPFIYAVKGSTKLDILHALESRLTNTPDVEEAEALTQIYRIAKSRLEDTIHA